MHFHFSIPSSVAFAPGTAETVGHLLLGFEVSKVLCIYDSEVKKAGLADAVLASLKAAKLEVTEWGAVQPNPTDELVEAGALLAKEAAVEAIVAVGGGSVIDAAKAVSILMTNESPINQYDGINLVKNPGVQVIAIPTTAGSASEVTSFTVITDTTLQKKMVIGGQNVGARVALVDPRLTVGAPPALTASTGMAAMAHAIEAYLSVANSIPTDINALKAIELIFHNLPDAVQNGCNMAARTNVLMGSILAGFAYNSAILGLAHSISHPLCVYSGVPHGFANAAVLPYVMEYNGQVVPERVKDIGVAMGLDIKDLAANEALTGTVDAILNLSRTIGIPTLKELGVSRDDFEKIALDSLKEISTIFNPRNPSKEDVIAILEKAFQ
ncbi:MAG: iron-containing alcohol dehydrogenase family protein [Geobacteraceae bacterium]